VQYFATIFINRKDLTPLLHPIYLADLLRIENKQEEFMGDNDLKYWIALKSIDGVGNMGFKNLVDALGSPKNVFDASLQTLKVIPGIGEKTAAHIKDFNNWKNAEENLVLAEKLKVDIVTFHDQLYPANLLNIYDFPVLLYVKGILSDDDINVAVVGSRMASTYGKFTTEKICRELALKGITVVSGLARGIDSAAHRGALAGKGRTIAVLGCGIDIVYPPENEKLLMEIAEKGAVITEFPFGTQPNAPNFPSRNRIISGMSLGVVVVEAGEKSGSLITARIALDQGREVFAVPGSIDSAGSRGTHQLIRQGAKLIESIDDILDEILPQIDGYFQKPVTGDKTPRREIVDKERTSVADAMNMLNDAEKAVFQCISLKKVDIDTVIASTGFKAAEVLNILLNLELRGLIEQRPGKMYLRKE
jgi:DNA processing protein